MTTVWFGFLLPKPLTPSQKSRRKPNISLGKPKLPSNYLSYQLHLSKLSTTSTSPTMESLHKFSLRLNPISLSQKCLNPSLIIPTTRFKPILIPKLKPMSNQNPHFFSTSRSKSFPSSTAAKAGWLLGLGQNKKTSLNDIVKAGDPVLHEPAKNVDPSEIGSDRIQKIIDDMIKVMRMAPGVGLAAPQIGVPLKIIVLEDTKEYISYAPKELIKAQDRRAFDLLVILNPILKKKSDRTALFFEGCLSVDGFRAVVERHLDVEVTGLSRDGSPIKVEASGWQARILQHECDHLDGTLYVDKMVPKTFRTVENMDLPLAECCPKLGPR